MITKLIAYNSSEIVNKLSLVKIKSWYKAGLINDEHWAGAKELYKTKMYSPSIFMRILLFGATLIGICTMLGPIFLVFQPDDEIGIQLIVLLTGIGVLFFTELKIIKELHHFKSGVTEGGYYVGLLFLYFGLLGIDLNYPIIYALVAALFFAIAAIRYLDLLSVVLFCGSVITVEFMLLDEFLALLPTITIGVFSLLFAFSKILQRYFQSVVWEDTFAVFDTTCLMLIYLGGNYFVVRELSTVMMGLTLDDGMDIPFAGLFYALTGLIPLVYLTWGIWKKSILYIRVSLLTLVLSVMSIKFYYLSDQPVIFVCVMGVTMILISVLLMHYLKNQKRGFTREKILTSKWENSDLTAYIASQTLGGHAIDTTNSFASKGGTFGGGGASGEF